MENEIMVNEEVLENTKEIVSSNARKGLVALVAGATILTGIIVYKKVIKRAIAKAKKLKEAEEIEYGRYDENAYDCEDSEE